MPVKFEWHCPLCDAWGTVIIPNGLGLLLRAEESSSKAHALESPDCFNIVKRIAINRVSPLEGM